MDAGPLDRRIVIQRASTSTDAFNEPVETFADLATVWASAKPVRDSERLANGQTLADISYRFVIRYSSTVADVNPKDRITFDDRTFDINAVKEIGRREGLEITATARAER